MLSALSIFDSKLDNIFHDIDDSNYHYSWSFMLGYAGVCLLLVGAAVFGGKAITVMLKAKPTEIYKPLYI